MSLSPQEVETMKVQMKYLNEQLEACQKQLGINAQGIPVAEAGQGKFWKPVVILDEK